MLKKNDMVRYLRIWDDEGTVVYSDVKVYSAGLKETQFSSIRVPTSHLESDIVGFRLVKLVDGEPDKYEELKAITYLKSHFLRTRSTVEHLAIPNRTVYEREM